MKNVIQAVPSEQHAKAAVQKIQKWIEVNYPKLAAVKKTKLIIECLIEVAEESKFIAAQ